MWHEEIRGRFWDWAGHDANGDRQMATTYFESKSCCTGKQIMYNNKGLARITEVVSTLPGGVEAAINPGKKSKWCHPILRFVKHVHGESQTSAGYLGQRKSIMTINGVS